MGAEAIFKGTQVDGIYSADPKKIPDATRFDQLTHKEVPTRALKVGTLRRSPWHAKTPFRSSSSIHEKGGFAEISGRWSGRPSSPTTDRVAAPNERRSFYRDGASYGGR